MTTTLEDLERRLADARREKAKLERANDRLLKLAKWAKSVGLKALGNYLERRAKNVRQRRATVMDRIDDLREKIKALGHVPAWLPAGFADYWNHPWTVPISGADDFKLLLWNHGLVSPNFTRREAGGQDRHPLGCAVPDSLRANVQRHAFTLERVRHDLGDRAMGPGSWYRCPPHNNAVGGASASQHMNAWATDWFDTERARLGGTEFDAAMERHFSNGGRGYQGAVGGPIRHVDNGPARVWVYA